MFPNVLQNFKLWIDGHGYAGVCDTVKVPKLEYLKEDHIGGGMTGKIDMRFLAHDTLKAEAHFISMEPAVMGLFGLAPRETVSFQFRGALSAEGSTELKAAVCYMRGFPEIEFEEWKVANKGGKTLPLSLEYLHLTVGDVSLVKLDPVNGVWERNGKSILSGLQQALG